MGAPFAEKITLLKNANTDENRNFLKTVMCFCQTPSRMTNVWREMSIIQEINDLQAKVVTIVDEDTAPYRLVMDQKELRNELRYLYAKLAEEKLAALMGKDHPRIKCSLDDPMGFGWYMGEDYSLSFEQSQYDDWDRWHTFLDQHFQIPVWSDRMYQTFPPATWDVSNDPDFDKSEQKSFKIYMRYYDSHFSGY